MYPIQHRKGFCKINEIYSCEQEQHLPQLTAPWSGLFLLPSYIVPLSGSTHQQWPVDPWHCRSSYVPSDLHCGIYAPRSPCVFVFDLTEAHDVPSRNETKPWCKTIEKFFNESNTQILLDKKDIHVLHMKKLVFKEDKFSKPCYIYIIMGSLNSKFTRSMPFEHYQLFECNITWTTFMVLIVVMCFVVNKCTKYSFKIRQRRRC